MSYSYFYQADSIGALLGLLPMMFPSALIGIAAYVLSSLALYTMAQRRGIHNAWLSWIPVVNCWILGSLSDQYRYVVLGQNRSKRKSLVILSVLSAILKMLMSAQLIGMIVNLVIGLLDGASEAWMMNALSEPVLTMLGMLVPFLAVSIAYAVINYMALYDVYKSLDPANCVVFLVLSILFGVTKPFFLFFNRNKDLGMPPRREQPAAAEPWVNP